jgi:predicted anti-sigma-YlaC factor YlaD
MSLLPEDHISKTCPSPDIAAYVDGELQETAEFALETHIAGCSVCRSELNFQKQFLNQLDHSLKFSDAIQLPADFAATVAVKAESRVSGLRMPRERSLTVMVFAVFATLILAILTLEPGTLINWATGALDRASAIFLFFFRLTYSVFYGFGVIFRSLGGDDLMPDFFKFVFFAAFAALLVPVVRMVVRIRRT